MQLAAIHPLFISNEIGKKHALCMVSYLSIRLLGVKFSPCYGHQIPSWTGYQPGDTLTSSIPHPVRSSPGSTEYTLLQQAWWVNLLLVTTVNANSVTFSNITRQSSQIYGNLAQCKYISSSQSTMKDTDTQSGYMYWRPKAGLGLV